MGGRAVQTAFVGCEGGRQDRNRTENSRGGLSHRQFAAFFGPRTPARGLLTKKRENQTFMSWGSVVYYPVSGNLSGPPRRGLRARIYRRGMPDGRGILPPHKAEIRAEAGMHFKFFNAARRQKSRTDGAQRDAYRF